MKKYISALGIGLLIVGVFSLFYFAKHFYGSTVYTTTDVKRGEMIDEVYAVGKVEPVSDAYLFFTNPGKITSLNAKVGDSVKPGDILASQDIKDIKSQVVEINAGVNVQQARINQLKAGASKESIDVASTAVSNAMIVLANAETSLKNSKQSSIDALKNTYTASEDIVKNKIDQLLVNPDTENPKLLFPVASDFSLGSQIEMQRVTIGVLLKKWNDQTNGLALDSDVVAEIIYTKSQLTVLKQYLEKVSSLVTNSTNKPTEVSATQWSQWRSEISAARTTVDALYSTLTTSQTSVSNGESSVKVAKGSLKTANDQLQLVSAGTRGTDLAVYQAQLAQASAAKAKIDALKQDLVITSPIAGQVAEVNGKIGEISGPNKVLFKVLSLDNLEIKVNVIENNITKVAIGQNVRVVFDAMPNREFVGRIIKIDPAETELNGTIYYKTTVVLDQKEGAIRSGMTANVWILSGKNASTLFVPASALVKKDDKIFVSVLVNNLPLEKEVETGMRDGKGNVEIKSGLEEGEQVILGQSTRNL